MQKPRSSGVEGEARRQTRLFVWRLSASGKGDGAASHIRRGCPNQKASHKKQFSAFRKLLYRANL